MNGSKMSLRAVRERQKAHKHTAVQAGNLSPTALVIIGASTGGPPVLEELLSLLHPADNEAYVIIQHMPMQFTKTFAERLDHISTLKVKEAEGGELLKPGTVLVAPGDHNIVLKREGSSLHGTYTIAFTDEKPVHAIQPNIDLFMESAAHQFDGPLLGIILTGMGQDGTRGMQALKQKGARTMVQEPTTCVVDSMVKSVIHHGCADEILPPDQMAGHIAAWAQKVK